MQAKLAYAIKFVADMDAAVAFYRDRFGLTLRFQSPEWSEFDTGEVTLALHPAGEDKPPGSTQLGFVAPGLEAAYAVRADLGLTFVEPPAPLHGQLLARVLDLEGAEVSLQAPEP